LRDGGEHTFCQTKAFMKYFNFFILQILSTGLLSAQELILDDGIYCEKPLLHDTSNHKYSLDNISYKINSVFIYDYYFLDKSGNKKKFLLTNDISSEENPLNLTSFDNKSDSVIDKIKIEVNDYLRMFSDYDSSYAQTVFSYSYLKRNGKSADTLCEHFKKKIKKFDIPCGDESTGIIDNKKNLWIHPPRTFTFKILQLNPYPFYCLDETVKTWAWNLETGGSYLDTRWINHKEDITIHFSYKRQKDEIVETPLGKLNCKVTDGAGSSELNDFLFKTSLKSFYHPKYGFVRLEYANINGTKLVIQLIDAK
jgi:hypothetical protein